MTFNSIDDLIAEFRAGRMVVLVDDEDRENEGDLVAPAALITPEQINFMARYGRGLICFPMTRERCEQLGLWLMVNDNREAQHTKFTVSIDASSGVSTGISAADRATTIRAATAARARPSDFVQPGHVFPLQAESGGVLTRAGHTEAGCDLARLAGLEPAAVLVEILNEDGTMARRPDLERFAAEHELKIGSIAELIQYRLSHERTIERVGCCRMPTRHGEFDLIAYQDVVEQRVHLALINGEIAPETPTLVRVHVHDPLTDLTASARSDAGWPIDDALRRVAAEAPGVVLILRHQAPEGEIIHRIRTYQMEDSNVELPQTDSAENLRTYGLGAQILCDLGVRKMRVLSAPKRMFGISGFGLEVLEYLS